MSSVVQKLVYDHQSGTVVEKRRVQSLRVSPAMIGPTSARPHISNSSGVLPHQVEEARQAVKDSGIAGVDFLPDGRAVCTCRGKRNKSGVNGLLSMRRHTNKDGGFGDV